MLLEAPAPPNNMAMPWPLRLSGIKIEPGQSIALFLEPKLAPTRMPPEEARGILLRVAEDAQPGTPRKVRSRRHREKVPDTEPPGHA